jgi:hypothetical protein
MGDVRVAGTAIICILAAFGAAFLVARAVKHGSPARAATPPRTTRVAATVTSTAGRVNAELVSQFAPVQASLKRRPKPHHRHHRKPSPQLAPVVTTASPTPAPTVTTTTPVSSAPVQSAPPPSQPSSSGSTTHKKKSSGGSGTTTIG